MRVTLAVILLLLLCAPMALADGTGTLTTSTLTSSVPGLTEPPATTTPAPTATSVATSPVSTGELSADPSGDLPFTGDNLLPETIGAVLLIAAGILIRLRWRPRW